MFAPFGSPAEKPIPAPRSSGVRETATDSSTPFEYVGRKGNIHKRRRPGPRLSPGKEAGACPGGPACSPPAASASKAWAAIRSEPEMCFYRNSSDKIRRISAIFLLKGLHFQKVWYDRSEGRGIRGPLPARAGPVRNDPDSADRRGAPCIRLAHAQSGARTAPPRNARRRAQAPAQDTRETGSCRSGTPGAAPTPPSVMFAAFGAAAGRSEQRWIERKDSCRRGGAGKAGCDTPNSGPKRWRRA